MSYADKAQSSKFSNRIQSNSQIRLWIWVATFLSAAFLVQGCQAPSYFKAQQDLPSYLLGSVNKIRYKTDLSKFENLTLGNTSSDGFSIARGYQISPIITAELNIADLGSLGISPEGRVNYLGIGGSALIYGFGKGSTLESENTTAGYLRAGFSILKAESDTEFANRDNVRFLAGVGIEHPLSNRYAIRAEIATLNNDIRYLQIGLLYRLKNRRAGSALESAVMMEETVDVRSTKEYLDSNISVLVMDFLYKSNLLGVKSIRRLMDLSEIMVANPEQRYVVYAHGDRRNTTAVNGEVVRLRSKLVGDYLISKGVKPEQLGFRLFGNFSSTQKKSREYGRSLDNTIEIALWQRSR